MNENLIKILDLLSQNKEVKAIQDTTSVSRSHTEDSYGKEYDIIQRKIDIINSLLPYLDDKTRYKAEYLIKILMIIRLIKELREMKI